jgi:hypothetical protein
MAMNDTPATEYAVYYPRENSYLHTPDGAVATYATITTAYDRGETWADSRVFEIHSRLNYTITPWQRVPEQP